ncbi:hypothetical protein ASA1KI_22610 [Opitutales bacterium ASA1]|nr:hypothetical protein ASA1KI_22610 [Opitutales bacterium ASA1]
MLVIRRLETREQGYTVLMLGPDYYRKFPTSIHEHNEILRLYKQDKRYRDVLNDFTDFDLQADRKPAE